MTIEEMEQAERLRELARERARAPISPARRFGYGVLKFLMSATFWVIVIPALLIVIVIAAVVVPFMYLTGAIK